MRRTLPLQLLLIIAACAPEASRDLEVPHGVTRQSVREGAPNPAPAALLVRNPGDCALEGTALLSFASGDAWASVAPTFTLSAGGQQSLTITFSTALLSPGVYTATLELGGRCVTTGRAVAPVLVALNLVVEPAAWRFDAGPFDAGPPLPALDGGTCYAVARSCAAAGPNLLENSDFETVPSSGGEGMEGLLPPPWQPTSASPDTYTTVGGFGLDPNAPATLGNFLGVSAHSGARWVAAWNDAFERGAQRLQAPLVPGRRYLAQAWLHQAVRSDLDNPGTYALRLLADFSGDFEVVGDFCPTASPGEGWVLRSFEFVAPPDAGVLPWLEFEPRGNAWVYPGLDDLTLQDITACP